MVRFDLSDILEDTNLAVSFEDMQNLAYKLSIQSSEYMANTKNLTTGLTPVEGTPISKLPDMDPTPKFINDKQKELMCIYDKNIPEMQAVNAFQLLIASGVLPLGWISANKAYSKMVYDGLFDSWRRILLDHTPLNGTEGPLYPHIKSFGILARMIGGIKNSNIVFFAIYDNQVDYNFLQSYLTKNNINNIILMTESEYAKNLVNQMYYRFLVKFDKIVSQYDGIIFKAATKLFEVVPTYALEIGCNPCCVLFREKGSSDTNPRFKTVEFKKGAPVSTIVYVPKNYRISLISLNGAAYFNGTQDMDAAGITIMESDVTTLTGYKAYEVIVSGLMDNAAVYIEACEDLTGVQSTKKFISEASTISVTNMDISIHLITNHPFIYLDPTKIKLYARKDDDAVEEELVTATSILIDGRVYKERKAIFADPYKKPTYYAAADKAGELPPYPVVPYQDRPREVMMGNNPNIYDNYKFTNGLCPTANEPELVDNMIVYSVTECGSIIITFDGFSKYKYFRVHFEDRAMIATIKVPGTMRSVDYIPVVEDVRFTNEKYDTIIDDDDEDGVNNDGNADNNTKPDVIIGSGLGFSYDAE